MQRNAGSFAVIKTELKMALTLKCISSLLLRPFLDSIFATLTSEGTNTE